MTPADAAELLAIAAAFDRRTVGRADAIAWADALTGLEPRDCGEAIRAHFRTSTDYLMPAHVRAGVRRIRAERIAAAPSSLLEPPNVDPDNVAAYLHAGKQRRRALANGEPLEEEPAQPWHDVETLAGQVLSRLPKMPELEPS